MTPLAERPTTSRLACADYRYAFDALVARCTALAESQVGHVARRNPVPIQSRRWRLAYEVALPRVCDNDFGLMRRVARRLREQRKF